MLSQSCPQAAVIYKFISYCSLRNAIVRSNPELTNLPPLPACPSFRPNTVKKIFFAIQYRGQATGAYSMLLRFFLVRYVPVLPLIGRSRLPERIKHYLIDPCSILYSMPYRNLTVHIILIDISMIDHPRSLLRTLCVSLPRELLTATD